MSNHLKFYIDGEWVDPLGKETLDVINPATEEPIATIALGNADDADRAVAAAKGASDSSCFSRKSRTIGSAHCGQGACSADGLPPAGG